MAGKGCPVLAGDVLAQLECVYLGRQRLDLLASFPICQMVENGLVLVLLQGGHCGGGCRDAVAEWPGQLHVGNRWSF